MRTTLLFLLLIFSACVTEKTATNNCQINNYSELQSLLLASSGGEGLSGLINVLPSLENLLISQISDKSENLHYCWYAQGSDLIGLAETKDGSVKNGYKYGLINGSWILKKEYELIRVISN